jgi:hypothetical protein
MKRVLPVTLLLMSFASLAFADGPGEPPPPVNTIQSPTLMQLADGPGEPPPPAHAIVIAA